ncbi:MAG: short-chain dehydrogenase [Planctomycetaceae bacterium]|nr:short-chain dehydrogenase [Planctomycetaceae bacterium]
MLASLKEAIEAEGGTCDTAVADLRSCAETGAAIEGLVTKLGGVDALINNAGLVIRKSTMEITPEEWRTMIETNVNGTFYATRAVLPHLKQQGSGHVVNVSSISGYMPLKGGSGYAASKHAVVGFSESLFQEVRELGIKVTTVFPGSVDSASHRADAGVAADWKVKPAEVGEAVLGLLETRSGNVVSRLEIRPLGRPPG